MNAIHDWFLASLARSSRFMLELRRNGLFDSAFRGSLTSHQMVRETPNGV